MLASHVRWRNDLSASVAPCSMVRASYPIGISHLDFELVAVGTSVTVFAYIEIARLIASIKIGSFMMCGL